jgi:hypothetical protein
LEVAVVARESLAILKVGLTQHALYNPRIGLLRIERIGWDFAYPLLKGGYNEKAIN